ncbi:hypothetical protein [Bacillus toyonensis]|nr:hypothetical protein [Bacillus toyonensis]
MVTTFLLSTATTGIVGFGAVIATISTGSGSSPIGVAVNPNL